MRALEVKTYPQKCLRGKTEPVGKFDQELTEILREMADVMYISKGVGLAAPQVGLDRSLLVVDAGDGLMKFVNPEILRTSGKETVLIEGCLSLPEVNVKVSRPEKIEIRAQRENGDVFTAEYDGLKAKILQHEIDHLHGRLIIDHENPIKSFLFKLQLIFRHMKKVKKDPARWFAMLTEEITAQIKKYMKSGEKVKLSALRFLDSKIQNRKKGLGKEKLEDREMLSILEKQVKQHRDSIEQFQKAAREDLIETEKEQMNVLKRFLPEELELDEIEVLVSETLKKTKATIMSGMGLVMRELMPKIKGRADGKVVSRIVQEKLS